MVYINEISGTITIPKHTQSSGTYTLVLTSNMSNPVTIVEDGSNISTNSLYYTFALNSPKLNVGEYTYTLYDDNNNVLETGLLVYGNFERRVIVNNTTTKEKVQYNG